MSNVISVNDYKGTRIEKAYGLSNELVTNAFNVTKTIQDNFNKGLIDEKVRDGALKELTGLLQKASKGEGSKGGKVIGHTRSGKPIYDSHGHPDHKKFNQEDHYDAMRHHQFLADKEPDYRKREGHYAQSHEHYKTHDKMDRDAKGIMGNTRSGKIVYHDHKHKDHESFGAGDHMDAANMHLNHQSKLIEHHNLDKDAKARKKAEAHFDSAVHHRAEYDKKAKNESKESADRLHSGQSLSHAHHQVFGR